MQRSGREEKGREGVLTCERARARATSERLSTSWSTLSMAACGVCKRIVVGRQDEGCKADWSAETVV